MKKRKLILRFMLLFIIFIVLSTLHVCSGGLISPMPYLQLDFFSGKVLDTTTKEPIKGAAVLAVYQKEASSVAGAMTWDVDAQETLTDENGEFKIPRKKRWFALYRGSSEGYLMIFKPGYGLFPDHKLSDAIGENKGWPTPKKYIVYELPKLETKEERLRNVFDTEIKYELPYNKQTIIINNVNTEFKNLELLDRYIEKGGKPILSIEEESK